jgi:hypothetical protein
VLDRLRHLRRVARRTWRAQRMKRRPTPIAGGLEVAVVGPEWMNWLFAPDVGPRPERRPPDLVVVGPDVSDELVERRRRDEGWGDAPVVGYRSDVEPGFDRVVVQPASSNPVHRTIHPDLPPELRRLAEHALRDPVQGRLVDEGLDAWVALERSKDAVVRAAFEHDVASLLREMAAAVHVAAPRADSDSVTVVCATNRPENLDRLVANVARQSIADCRLVLVTNDEGFDDSAVDAALAALPGSTRVHVPPDRTLGECLNRGLDITETRIVAKFDDDDHYEADYLSDMVATLVSSRAAVAGKHSYLVYLAATDTTWLRFPGHEHRYTSFVAGGTLVIDRHVVPDVAFQHRNTGEDSGFLAASERAGGLIVSAGALGYVQYRGASNTWDVSADRFLRHAVELGAGSPDGCFSSEERGQ